MARSVRTIGKRTAAPFRLVCVPGVDPPTDDALIGALLAVANGDPFEYFSGPGPGSASSAADIEAIRPRFRELVHAGATNRAALASRFIPEVGAPLLQSLKVRIVIQFGARGFTDRYDRAFGTLETALNYAVMLLLNLEKRYGADLCQCQLKRCGRFYLATKNPKGGPANRNYCSPPHRLEASNRKENRTARKPK